MLVVERVDDEGVGHAGFINGCAANSNLEL
jgi:hypothetical protein